MNILENEVTQNAFGFESSRILPKSLSLAHAPATAPNPPSPVNSIVIGRCCIWCLMNLLYEIAYVFKTKSSQHHNVSVRPIFVHTV